MPWDAHEPRFGRYASSRPGQRSDAGNLDAGGQEGITRGAGIGVAIFLRERSCRIGETDPEETIVMDPGSEELGNRRSVLAGAARFAKRGATLVRLAFPTTEIQRYGSIAIIYSTYFYELEQRGKRTPFSGRITEVFVFRKDPWVNPGWHTLFGVRYRCRCLVHALPMVRSWQSSTKELAPLFLETLRSVSKATVRGSLAVNETDSIGSAPAQKMAWSDGMVGPERFG
jgi:hypothetical protein